MAEEFDRIERGSSGPGRRLITVWLEVRALPGPPLTKVGIDAIAIFLLSPAERRDCPFNGFNQRLAMPPIIKPNIDFVTLLGATTPYRGTKRGQSSAGGEGQGPELGWIV